MAKSVRRRRRSGDNILDPRKSIVFLDANSLDDCHYCDIKCVEKICHLNNNLDDYGVIFQLPNLVRQEIDHVNTPEYVKRRACDFIYTTMTPLKPDESILSANLRSHFKGNGVGDRHTADSNHIFEALKYGAGYFITEDARIKKKSNALDIRVLSRHEFIVVLDKFEIL